MIHRTSENNSKQFHTLYISHQSQDSIAKRTMTMCKAVVVRNTKARSTKYKVPKSYGMKLGMMSGGKGYQNPWNNKE